MHTKSTTEDGGGGERAKDRVGEPGASRDVREHYAALATAYEGKANKACERAYADLLTRCLASAERILELGSGASRLLAQLDAPFKAACDFSEPMLRAKKGAGLHRIVSDAAFAPFPAACFDGVFCINLLEHVSNPARVIGEARRLLVPGGRFVAVTPNGDLEKLLGLLERLHLKIPEGPHRFLTFNELAELAGGAFDVLEHRRFLAFPAGPRFLVNAAERLLPWGLFQYVVARKRTS
ncbi:MAG TPA: methyltransferase domain-containing protein [Candidatus Hydrogenedentes bacterium]|nr:methyltransferase domain-containing protein [Candidatus Hydrogenedentota bacterium]